MSTTIGTIALNMVLNSSQFRTQLNDVQGLAQKAGQRMSASFKKLGAAIAGAFSVALIKKFGQECIENAASVQAANAQFEQTFGDLSDTAGAAMKKVADESGIVQMRLQGVGTSIYAFAKAAGMDSANAMNMMSEALQVTADSAAYYDRSLEDTAESLKSFLKGNFANDAALGVSCTETTRNIAANKLYGKSFKDLSEAQKQLTLLQMVKDANAASGALGQAARESDGLENVLGNLKETWRQFLAVIGKPVLKAAVVVIQNVTTALGKMLEVAKAAVGELGKVFGWEANDTAAIAQSTADSIAESASNEEDLADATKKANKEAKNSVASFDKLNVLTKSDDKSDDTENTATPAAALSPIASLIKQADKASNSFKKAFGNLYEKSGAKNFVKNLQKGLDKINFGAIKKNCQEIIKKTEPIIKSGLKNVRKIGNSALSAFGAKAGMVVTIAGGAVQTLTGGVSKWLSKDSKKIQKYFDTIGDKTSKGFNNLAVFYDMWGTLAKESMDKMRPQTEEAISNLLSGFTTLGGSLGEVFSGAFEIATGILVEWIENNRKTIKEFFNSLQQIFIDVCNFFGGVFEDIGNIISSWWNGEDGAPVFKSVCEMFTNIGTTLMNVWNEWIMPVWDFIVKTVQSAWDKCLKPVFEKLLGLFGKIGAFISEIWNKWCYPFVNFLIKTFGPVFDTVLKNIWSVCETVFTFIGDIVGSIIDVFGGVIDFLGGVFTLNWEKAWKGICEIFGGIFETIWGVMKGIINLIIDGVNMLWTGIYTFVAAIINTVGGIADVIGSVFGQNWGWTVPNEPALIPHLAHGGIVTAPTLALVGDNAGANSGNPEVVAPLNKLQGMINSSGGQDVVILTQILDMLNRIYEMFVIFKNNGGNVYEFIAKMDGSELFREVVKQDILYKKRHGGKSAFA